MSIAWLPAFLLIHFAALGQEPAQFKPSETRLVEQAAFTYAMPKHWRTTQNFNGTVLITEIRDSNTRDLDIPTLRLLSIPDAKGATSAQLVPMMESEVVQYLQSQKFQVAERVGAEQLLFSTPHQGLLLRVPEGEESWEYEIHSFEQQGKLGGLVARLPQGPSQTRVDLQALLQSLKGNSWNTADWTHHEWQDMGFLLPVSAQIQQQHKDYRHALVATWLDRQLRIDTLGFSTPTDMRNEYMRRRRDMQDNIQQRFINAGIKITKVDRVTLPFRNSLVTGYRYEFLDVSSQAFVSQEFLLLVDEKFLSLTLTSPVSKGRLAAQECLKWLDSLQVEQSHTWTADEWIGDGLYVATNELMPISEVEKPYGKRLAVDLLHGPDGVKSDFWVDIFQPGQGGSLIVDGAPDLKKFLTAEAEARYPEFEQDGWLEAQSGLFGQAVSGSGLQLKKDSANKTLFAFTAPLGERHIVTGFVTNESETDAMFRLYDNIIRSTFDVRSMTVVDWTDEDIQLNIDIRRWDFTSGRSVFGKGLYLKQANASMQLRDHTAYAQSLDFFANEATRPVMSTDLLRAITLRRDIRSKEGRVWPGTNGTRLFGDVGAYFAYFDYKQKDGALWRQGVYLIDRPIDRLELGFSFALEDADARADVENILNSLQILRSWNQDWQTQTAFDFEFELPPGFRFETTGDNWADIQSKAGKGFGLSIEQIHLSATDLTLAQARSEVEEIESGGTKLGEFYERLELPSIEILGQQIAGFRIIYLDPHVHNQMLTDVYILDHGTSRYIFRLMGAGGSMEYGFPSLHRILTSLKVAAD